MIRRLLLPAAVLLPAGVLRAQSPPHQSRWVYENAQHQLVYKTTERGDRILDFSYAGYGGGGVALPSPPVTITVAPQAGDNTGAIQHAIDAVSARPRVNGIRGVVLLSPGTYRCDNALTINASGVVLRGSGSGENGTVLLLTGKPHPAVILGGRTQTAATGRPAGLADVYVPSGARSFAVTSATGLAAGDTVSISKPVTPQWVQFMGMAGLVRDGKPQTWITGDIAVTRTIRQISGNTITVDVPLTDSYDPRYLRPAGAAVAKISSSGFIEHTGIENFRITCAPVSVTINEGSHKAFIMRGVRDGWAQNITAVNTVNSITVSDACRVTLKAVNVFHELPTIGAAKPADFSGNGSQLLFDRCTAQGDNVFYFATGAKVSGPIVLLHCTFRGNGWIQPHQRWATGVLVDNCKVPGGGIDFMNRGAMGSGHGWSIGWAVAWNCEAKTFLNQQPPGSANWVIGSSGEQTRRAIPFDTIPYLPEGIYDAHGARVTPGSLYLAQLRERMGESALRQIGY